MVANQTDLKNPKPAILIFFPGILPKTQELLILAPLETGWEKSGEWVESLVKEVSLSGFLFHSEQLKDCYISSQKRVKQRLSV